MPVGTRSTYPAFSPMVVNLSASAPGSNRRGTPARGGSEVLLFDAKSSFRIELTDRTALRGRVVVSQTAASVAQALARYTYL